MITKFAKIATLFIVFLMVAGASAYLTLTFIIKSEDTVIVPDLVGKNVVTALELLTDLQLNTKVNGSEYSRQFPKNHVTYQEPEPGSEIKKDRDIRIIISKGPKNILMPGVVSLRNDYEALSSLHYELKRRFKELKVLTPVCAF